MDYLLLLILPGAWNAKWTGEHFFGPKDHSAKHTCDSWIFAVISRSYHCADLLVRIREDYASLYRLTVHAKYLLMAAE